MGTARARTQDQKARRRDAVLAAALDAFVEKGFSGARMDDIARRAGLSKAAVYLYFDSKEALFSALLEQVALANVAQLETLLNDAGDLDAALHAFAAFAPRLVRDTPLPQILKILVSEAGTFPEVVQAYRRNIIERVLSALAGALRKAQRDGRVIAGDPHLLARLMVAPVILSALWQVMFEAPGAAVEGDRARGVDLDALMALHAQVLSRGLAPDAGAAGPATGTDSGRDTGRRAERRS